MNIDLNPIDIETWVVKHLIVIAIVCGVGTGIACWMMLHAHQVAKAAVAVAIAHEKVDAAQTTAGGDAVNQISANQHKSEQTDAQTQKLVQNFNTYPAAKSAVDPALFDAFRSGICMYQSAAGLSECRKLQQPDP
jgi:hypothetical protein